MLVGLQNVCWYHHFRSRFLMTLTSGFSPTNPTAGWHQRCIYTGRCRPRNLLQLMSTTTKRVVIRKLVVDYSQRAPPTASWHSPSLMASHVWHCCCTPLSNSRASKLTQSVRCSAVCYQHVQVVLLCCRVGCDLSVSNLVVRNRCTADDRWDHDMWGRYCCLTSFFSDCRYMP